MHPISESPSAQRHHELLKKYFIPNMGDYTAVGSVLSSILDRLDKHKGLLGTSFKGRSIANQDAAHNAPT